MKIWKKGLRTLLVLALVFALAACNKNEGNENNQGQNTENPSGENNNNQNATNDVNNGEPVEANLISVGKFQKAVKEALNIETVESIYNIDYQNQAQALIDEYKAGEDYSISNPLFIMNPYGTNRTGVYTYFKTDEAVNINYTVSVEDENIADYTAQMYSNVDGSPVTEHEGQIIGLIPGMVNTVTLNAVNDKDETVATYIFEFNVPDFGTLDKLYFETTVTGDTDKLTDGLYTIIDYDLQDPEEYAHLLLTDNTGVIRSEIVLDAVKHNPDVAFIGENMVYPSDFNTIAVVNRLGKVEALYSLGDYHYHHDMEYNPANNTIAILADDTNRDTIEEIVISLDLESGEVSLVADFEVLMNDIYKRATRPEQNMTFGTEFDWIHFNAVAFVNDTDILLSSRELSSVIRVDNIYENPTVSAIIADEAIWADTAYADITYSKEGEFSSHAGQHHLMVFKDESLEEGQYYLTMYNNNWGYSPTWPEFDWSQLEGVNLGQNELTQGYMGSAFYAYLVDDNNKTYTLLESHELPYSSFVSNAQVYNGNIVYCSGSQSTSGVFGEIDSEGNTLVEFKLNADAFVAAYRTFKYSYENFWFN